MGFDNEGLILEISVEKVFGLQVRNELPCDNYYYN